MKKNVLIILSILAVYTSYAQELYPMAEPANNIPKNVLSIRASDQVYTEINNIHRHLFGLRFSYGITSKLTLSATGTVSNHHSKDLPSDFPYHNTPQVGVKLPYRFNGINLYAKYRFLSYDGQNKHFRVAAYAEYSQLKVAHDEAEPNLLDDTKGYGGGLIATGLLQRFAASVTVGGIFPSPYKGEVPDLIPSLPGAPAKIVYANGAQYSLSLGYLLLPRKYKNYKQTNLNIYLELLGKSYGTPKIYLENVGQPGSTYQVTGIKIPALTNGHYIEMHPGLQVIIKSNLRVDLSAGFPLMSRSYARFYPIYSIGIQRYFYF